MKWLTGLVSLAGLAAVVAWCALHVSSRPEEKPGAPAGSAEVSQVPAPTAPLGAGEAEPSEPPQTDIRRQVHEAVEHAARAIDEEHRRAPEDALQYYLDGLLARARAQGRVTALEAEAGMEMIARLGGSLETQIEFSTRLNALAHELRGEPAGPAPTPEQTLGKLDVIADRIATQTFSDEGERRALIDEYLGHASSLEPALQVSAMQRLNQLAGNSGRPRPLDIERQWSVVERARGAGRQAAIRELIEAVHQLPPDQQIEHMQRLDQLVRDTETPTR